MVTCPVCAHQNEPRALFCTYCGAELEAAADTLQPGQFVDGGTYRIIRQLGKGGMGAVYLAANTKAFDRPCVVKEVIEYFDPNDPQEREKAVRRFESEARTLALLKHPGIPDIYAYFTESGRNYLVMEYIEGTDLSEGLTREKEGQIVKGRARSVEDVVRYAIQICEVLDYLENHQPPVTHNDIKPANIILDPNSKQPVLVDFGTAKTRYSRQAAGQPGRQQSSVYGTVGYAAAELYNGTAEPRSDVYALAVTVYHLLTDDDPRKHPFQFPKMDEVPKPVRRVLRAALDDDIGKRPSAAQLGQRLQEALQILHPAPNSASLVRPITFPNQATANTRAELLSLCVQNWAYAADILYDGSIAHWLSDALHDAQAARTAQEAVRRHADDPDAGLAYLIRTLDPNALPAARLNVITGQLKVERAGGPAPSIDVANTGGGMLFGSVTASAPWIQVAERIRCAPGKTQSLPVVVDTEMLSAGQTYQAEIKIQGSDAQSASIPIQVRVPPPAITITPTQIDLGKVRRKDLYTDKGAFEIRNRGAGRADCRIVGHPAWLILDPQRFTCPTGQTQVVELVGRADLLPEGPRHTATLQVEIEGAGRRQVQVVVQCTAKKKAPSRAGAAIAIGSAVVILLGTIVWFVLQVLPLFIP
jgi:serine/threonine protein kinase